jgi:hypothetical protein
MRRRRAGGAGGARGAALALAVQLLLLPQPCDAVLWQLTSGKSAELLPTHEVAVSTVVGSDSALLNLGRFYYAEGGHLSLSAQVILHENAGVFPPQQQVFSYLTRNASRAWFELLTCSSSEFSDMVAMERDFGGTFCATRHLEAGFCQRFPLAFDRRSTRAVLATDPAADALLGVFSSGAGASAGLGVGDNISAGEDIVAGVASGGARISRLQPAGLRYMVLSACEFTTRLPLGNAHVVLSAWFDPVNLPPAGRLSLPAARLRSGELIAGFVFSVLALGWVSHLWLHFRSRDISLQLLLAPLFLLKLLSVLALAVALQLKSDDAPYAAALAALGARIVLLAAFAALLMDRLLLLTMGFKVLHSTVEARERRRCARLSMLFGFISVLTLWLDEASMLMWVVLLFFCIMISSSMYRHATVNMWEVYVQSQETVELYAALQAPASPELTATPAQLVQLRLRIKFLAATMAMMKTLRRLISFYFFLLPVLLTAVQLLLSRYDSEDGALPTVTLLAEAADALFLAVLAWTFRLRPLEKFFAQPRAAAGAASAAASAAAGSAAPASPGLELRVREPSAVSVERERSAVGTSAVFPIIEEREREPKPAPQPQVQQGHNWSGASPIMSVSFVGDEQARLAVALGYDQRSP